VAQGGVVRAPLKEHTRRPNKVVFFTGLANYVSYPGERLIAITWQLRHPLPGDTFANFRAAVA